MNIDSSHLILLDTVETLDKHVYLGSYLYYHIDYYLDYTNVTFCSQVVEYCIGRSISTSGAVVNDIYISEPQCKLQQEESLDFSIPSKLYLIKDINKVKSDYPEMFL